MGKLHEVLAVEKDLANSNKHILQETQATFTKRTDHFIGYTKRYEAFDEDDVDKPPTEHKEMDTTVGDKLDHMFGTVVSYLDTVYQKEKTNQEAKADIEVDGKTVATQLPATFLLGLEDKLRSWRSILSAIPTLAPGIKWEKNDDLGKGVYTMAHPEETIRTRKVMKPVVLYEATDKHPAQVKEATENTPVGKFVKDVACGMMSPAEKSDLLARLDKLTHAVKQARQRANMAEVVDARVGDAIVKYLKGDE